MIPPDDSSGERKYKQCYQTRAKTHAIWVPYGLSKPLCTLALILEKLGLNLILVKCSAPSMKGVYSASVTVPDDVNELLYLS